MLKKMIASASLWLFTNEKAFSKRSERSQASLMFKTQMFRSLFVSNISICGLSNSQKVSLPRYYWMNSIQP